MNTLTLNDVASFIWLWNNKFFLEAGKKGNYIWSDPEYPGGDNSIRKVEDTLVEYLKKKGIPFGRDKGVHTIEGYCGNEVKFL